MSITQCTATHLAEVLDGSHHEQQCAYAAGHSGDHLFSFHDESDAIRWKLAADARDEAITALQSARAEVERLREAEADARRSNREYRDDVFRLTAERDTARAELLECQMMRRDAEIVAEDRGRSFREMKTKADSLSARVLELEGKLERSLNTSERVDVERMAAVARAEKAERECEAFATPIDLMKQRIERDTAERIAAWLDDPEHGRATRRTVEQLRSGSWRTAATGGGV